MQAADAQDDKAGETPWAAFAGIIATVSVFAISQGLSYPLLSFILQRQGISPALIGASAAMTPLGFIVSSPFIPWMSRRFGAARLAVGCAVAAALMLALIALVQDVGWWFPLRFLLGFAANPLYVVSETWMIAIAPPEKRGRLMGVYTSIVSAGFALGPLTLAIVGTQGWPPFLVGIVAFLICGLILIAILPRLPAMSDDDHATSVAGFARMAPLLLLAVFVAAAFEQSLLALMSVYGEAYDSAEGRIASLLTVFIAGNIALQVPFGALAERIGWRPTMLICATTAVAGCILLPPLFDTALIWPIAFIWGAVAFCIYTMALVGLGERFSGSMLITGNAAFALFWGIGGIAGPPLTGALMDAVGVQGLPLANGALCATLAVALVAQMARGNSTRDSAA